MDLLGSSALGISQVGSNGDLRLANYPNPFIGSTTIAYTLPVSGEVTLEIRDMPGSIVQTPVSSTEQQAGDYKLLLDAATLAPGVYMATLKLAAGGRQMVRTIKIVRTR
jgi:hypothetical protein